jgi:hypothetical protein
MSDSTEKNSDRSSHTLEEAAQAGPLPGAVEADDAARRGEDHSVVNDPEEQAEENGAETIPGGINMR